MFGTEAGWVLVCRTSVRLVIGREISRIELAGTVRRAWRRGAGLQVGDVWQMRIALTVVDDRLVRVRPGRFVIDPRP